MDTLIDPGVKRVLSRGLGVKTESFSSLSSGPKKVVVDLSYSSGLHTPPDLVSDDGTRDVITSVSVDRHLVRPYDFTPSQQSEVKVSLLRSLKRVSDSPSFPFGRSRKKSDYITEPLDGVM